MTIVEAPESTKQLCSLLLKTSNVNKKWGIWDLDYCPIKALLIDKGFGSLAGAAWFV